MQKKKLGSLKLVLKLLPAVMLLALGLSYTPLGQELENLTLDWRFQARAKSDPPAHPKVLIVGIDEDALAKFGRWPSPKELNRIVMNGKLEGFSTLDIDSPDEAAA